MKFFSTNRRGPGLVTGHWSVARVGALTTRPDLSSDWELKPASSHRRHRGHQGQPHWPYILVVLSERFMSKGSLLLFYFLLQLSHILFVNDLQVDNDLEDGIVNTSYLPFLLF